MPNNFQAQFVVSFVFALLTTATLAQTFSQCPTPGNIFINAGGNPTSDGYRCDVPGQWRNSSHKYSRKHLLTDDTLCTQQYYSHSSLFGKTDLVYNIPVPQGTFAVSLMFMETWKAISPGIRLFTISVNGKAVNSSAGGLQFDIFTLAGGADKPYIVSTTVIHSGGNLVINIGRVPGKENPMLSGISISGPRADDLIKNTGLESCSAPFEALPNSPDSTVPAFADSAVVNKSSTPSFLSSAKEPNTE